MQIWVEGKPYHPHDWQGLEACCQHEEWLRPALNFLKFWFSDGQYWSTQTSGSTGAPKQVQFHRSRLIASASATISYFNINPRTDGFASAVSAQYVGGFMVLVRALVCQADVWLLKPASIPDLTANQNMNPVRWLLSLVPVQFQELSRLPNALSTSASWLGILIGGAGLSAAQMQLAGLWNCPVFQSFGMTETVSHFAIRTITGPEQAYKLLPGVEVRVNDGGCLEVKSAITENQWITTNDRVMLVNGGFEFLGRADDIINSGGLKIDPLTVISALAPIARYHPEKLILQGQPDERLGERVVLVVVGEPTKQATTNWEEVMHKASLVLDKRQLPKAVYSIQKLPLLPNLKTDRLQLQAMIKASQPIWTL